MNFDKQQLSALSDCSTDNDITWTIIPSDVNKTKYSEEHKREVILDLLRHFKAINNSTNTSLSNSGESKYCSPFENISVSDIKDYALIGTGFEDF